MNKKMNKKTSIICVIFSTSFLGLATLAADKGVHAAAIFAEAEMLQSSHEDAIDADLVGALNDLGKMVSLGKRHLLNQEVDDAIVVAERVSVQMEFVKVCVRLVLFKEKLAKVQKEADGLAHKKEMLRAQYRRLLLLQKGRALTGAFPAPKEEGDDK